jgi:hypothetical protein
MQHGNSTISVNSNSYRANISTKEALTFIQFTRVVACIIVAYLALACTLFTMLTISKTQSISTKLLHDRESKLMSLTASVTAESLKHQRVCKDMPPVNTMVIACSASDQKATNVSYMEYEANTMHAYVNQLAKSERCRVEVTSCYPTDVETVVREPMDHLAPVSAAINQFDDGVLELIQYPVQTVCANHFVDSQGHLHVLYRFVMSIALNPFACFLLQMFTWSMWLVHFLYARRKKGETTTVRGARYVSPDSQQEGILSPGVGTTLDQTLRDPFTGDWPAALFQQQQQPYQRRPHSAEQ